MPQVLQYERKAIIRIHVLPSSEVHSYKKVIYDRINDSDIKVTSTTRIAELYIRKYKVFTEKKVYPYTKDDDLRFDMIPRIRQMALNRSKDHPWGNMTDKEVLQSAGFTGEDPETGNRGYNLAAIMLVGRDDVIFSTNPVHRTDALLRKVNLERYDDRAIVPLDDEYSCEVGRNMV